MEKGFKYIYNVIQASFYITKFKCVVLDTGVNPNTRKVWYKFNFEETQEAYVAWCRHCNQMGETVSNN